ncbi:23S rRNA (guanosine(2251)-2'-O)-methyltransferase RlmB [uncultured Amnibacterium sp.]|uniref:23S rRNA (guanosine(2251)-2'-O)-methyltransferase RlmB n=1 Tax=uncultured Amnibacterium sp. TaxID=1631851 RepID=UPI0035CB5FFE
MAGDARRRTPNKKGTKIGSGGQGRQALEGKGPTPKAEDRTYHQAHKRRQLADRSAAKRSDPPAARPASRTPRKKASTEDLVTGRNAVLEALRARIPATTVYIAARMEVDDRIRETLSIANKRDIPVLEIMRPELDRLTGGDLLHQGIALAVKPYEYAHPMDLLQKGSPSLVVALDGVTDPRNLGAIIRSVAAFGGDGVVLPQRRSVGVTPAAWRASAGAIARVPVAMASNLAQTITAYKQAGVFVVGLDGGGDVTLPAFDLADRPLLVVAGSEGQGLSRLVRDLCDQIVSIPIGRSTESLNASVATSIALYAIAATRAAAE